MKLLSSILLDYSLFYVIILLCSCVFVFAVFEIYFDRKKNLWNLSGPFPLPLIGKEDFKNNLNLLNDSNSLLGNAFLLAGPAEQFIQTMKSVRGNRKPFPKDKIKTMFRRPQGMAKSSDYT